MKKILLSLSALFILGLPELLAQTIPNPGFETWSTDVLAPGAKDPNTGNGTSGWWDFNMVNSILFGSSPITVFQDNANPSPEQGSYCAKIISNTMSTSTYNVLQSDFGAYPFPRTFGVIFTAYIDISYPNYAYKPGIPFHAKMSSFSFYYRYIPNGSDSCSCTVTLSHYNTVTKTSDIIGGGFWADTAKVTTWTPATVNITYDSATVTPDTVLIVFSACALDSASNPKAGDTMNIDNISDILTGINTIQTEHDKVNVYPNPANNSINLSITGQVQGSRVEIYDITGNLIGAYTMRNNFLTINTQSYNTGIYFYKLYDDAGTQLNVGKFSVIR